MSMSPYKAEADGTEAMRQMVEAVQADADPCAGMVAQLRALAHTIWCDMKGAHACTDGGPGPDLADVLRRATPKDKELFFKCWALRVYDTTAQTVALELDKKSKDQSLYSWVKSKATEFYAELLDVKNEPDPAKSQRETPLEATSRLFCGCPFEQRPWFL
jgi:hypothetical protein